MQNRSVGLVAIDLDGTLLGDDGELAPGAAESVLALQAEKIPVTLVTGRTYHATRPFAEALRLQDPVTVLDGCWVRAQAAVILEQTLDPEAVRRTVLSAAASRLACALHIGEDDGRFLVPAGHASDALIEAFFEAERQRFFLPGHAVRTLDGEVEAGVHVIVVFGRSSALAHWAVAIRPELAGRADLDVRTFHPLYHGRGLEEASYALVRPYGTDKLMGVAATARLHGIGLDRVMAFGDWVNDVRLLNAVGHAVLMGNAPPEVRRRVRNPRLHVTGTNNEGGVAAALSDLGLIR